MQGYTAYDRYNDRRAEILQANFELARSVSKTFDAFVDDVLHQEVAVGTALDYGFTVSSQEENSLLFTAVHEQPAVYDMYWLDSAGVVQASSNPRAPGVQLNDRAYFQMIVQGREWVVSEVLQERVSGRPSFVIARGIRGQGNVLRGIVVGIVDPQQLGDALRVERSQQGAVSIIDDKGSLVYRYPPATGFSATDGSWDSLVKAALTGQEVGGTFVSTSDGQERLGGFVPISSVGWVASASLPESDAYAMIQQDPCGS